MAISPDDTTSLTTDEITLRTEIEALIDAQLLLSFEEEKAAEVRHAVIYQAFEQHPRLLENIISRYETEGWQVIRYENDCQGPWLSFSRAPE